MTRVVMHRLTDGRWRVTDAPDGWVDDGRDHPEPKASDRVFEHQSDAIREYLERTSPRDPEDEPIDRTSEDTESGDS
jgi:hypothetical protein